MSVLDLLAELTGVSKPDGDPAALRQAATHLAGVADGLDRTARGLGSVDDQARAGWTGRATDAFTNMLIVLSHYATIAASTLREAAGAVNAYASRLEAAQASWAGARNGAIAAHVTPLVAAVEPEMRRAVAQAEHADVDAKLAAIQLAAELNALTDRAAPLPDGVQAPDARLGGWLMGWLDRAREDPLGAVGEYYKQFAAGIGDGFKDFWDLGVMGAKLSPVYAALDWDGYEANAMMVGGMLLGLVKLTDAYGYVDPVGQAHARERFVKSLVNWETLRTGNLPRWTGSFVPDVALAAATAGTGAAASAEVRGATALTRGAVSTARGAAAEARLSGTIRNVNPLRGTTNCLNCAVATDATLAGRPASALLSTPQPAAVLEKMFNSKFVPVAGQAEVETLLRAAGPGARGIIWGDRGPGKIGHVFNTLNQRGTIRFLDGQIGGQATFAGKGYVRFFFLRTG